MSNIQILLAILTFVVLTFGTFVWFVATWDPAKVESLSFFGPKISPPEAQILLAGKDIA